MLFRFRRFHLEEIPFGHLLKQRHLVILCDAQKRRYKLRQIAG